MRVEPGRPGLHLGDGCARPAASPVAHALEFVGLVCRRSSLLSL